MKKKRLAVISYHTCPLSDEVDAEIGGMNIYVLELFKKLAQTGCYIDIFTRSQSPQSPRVVQVLPTLRVIHLPAGAQEPLSKKVISAYIPEFLESFYTFLKDDGGTYDVLSCHYYLSGLIGLRIREKLGIPFTITFHTLGLMKNLVARSEREREDTERIKTELHLVQKADKVIATSSADAMYLRTLYSADPSKVSVLKPGVDTKLFTPRDKIAAKKRVGAPMDTKLILFVGRIEPLKGIDVLMYAVKAMISQSPEVDICVWIVGGDISRPSAEWPEELKKLSEIRQLLGISTAVTFVGRKEQHELPDYYNAADVLVMPSHYESFGITAVEAMACGVPVITTDATGVSSLFDDEMQMLITSANNPLLLAEKISILLQNPTMYQSLSKKVSTYATHLTWDHAAKEFIGICSTCR